MVRRAVLIAFVLAANGLAAWLAVAWSGETIQVCADTFRAGSPSGCTVIDESVAWGAGHLVVLALMLVSLFALARYLLRGARRWLVATLTVAAAFVVVPATYAVPAALNDSGSVRLGKLLDR
ncbi:hypothetical protein C8N24_0841 [Solirubrobacter pauli]|uniref:Uncharacterized protein n=1 Tax=Solirubrobacter pauli TaxID=166793 RepID=A0A660L9T7_9ACTN|nr:hypothetical protein [Solirubrobacter pauli]RKQ91025.1 hypothetical protein C8N24_0841 [Solirubrobacter pauli]